MSAPRDGIVRRSLRRFVLGGGVVKRPSDRIQMLGRFLVLLSFLLGPPVAVAVTDAVGTDLRTVAELDAAERTRTQATLLEAVKEPDVPPGAYGDGSARQNTTRAVWTLPDGTSREGAVEAPPGTPAGASVEVWVDRKGDITMAPLDANGIAATATACGFLTLLGLPLAGLILYLALCLALDIHRDRRWERAWAEVEPDWHSRLL